MIQPQQRCVCHGKRFLSVFSYHPCQLKTDGSWHSNELVELEPVEVSSRNRSPLPFDCWQTFETHPIDEFYFTTAPPGSEGFLSCHWFIFTTHHTCPLAPVDWSQIVPLVVSHGEISQWDERGQAWRVCSPQVWLRSTFQYGHTFQLLWHSAAPRKWDLLTSRSLLSSSWGPRKGRRKQVLFQCTNIQFVPCMRVSALTLCGDVPFKSRTLGKLINDTKVKCHQGQSQTGGLLCASKAVCSVMSHRSHCETRFMCDSSLVN